jgi:hypothetical protein
LTPSAHNIFQAKKARRRQTGSDDEGSVIVDNVDMPDPNGEADDIIIIDDPTETVRSFSSSTNYPTD